MLTRVLSPRTALKRGRRAFGVLTHIASAVNGVTSSVMVNVDHKATSSRVATAEATVYLPPPAWTALHAVPGGKAAIFNTASIAGVLAAKRTSEAIPLCHLLALDGCDIYISTDAAEQSHDGRVVVRGTVSTTGKTGVEMEALHAVSLAALTLYDMLKASSKAIVVERICLLSKRGGRSGEYSRGGTDVDYGR